MMAAGECAQRISSMPKVADLVANHRERGGRYFARRVQIKFLA
jgi:hypothetical protein